MSTESTITTRREFLFEAASAIAVGALASDVLASQQPAGPSGLPTRVLGRTGERVSHPLPRRMAHRLREGSGRGDPHHARRCR